MTGVGRDARVEELLAEVLRRRAELADSLGGRIPVFRDGWEAVVYEDGEPFVWPPFDPLPGDQDVADAVNAALRRDRGYSQKP